MSRPLPSIPGCWRHIGVEGDRSCPELKTVIHCRNCPVFSDEAARLFERPPPPGYTARWTETLGEADARGRLEGTESAVVFRVGDEWLGLPAAAAAFVASEVAVRQIAGRSNRVFSGLCMFLGELTLAVSLRGLLGLGPSQGPGVRWLAMGEPAERWVFDIDELAGVLRFSAGDRTNAPTERHPTVATYLAAVIRSPGRTCGLRSPGALNEAFLGSLARAP